MIRHRKQKSDAEELRRRLAEAQQEKRDVVREGHASRPLLQRLKQQLRDNSFAERFVAGMEQTRRRHA